MKTNEAQHSQGVAELGEKIKAISPQNPALSRLKARAKAEAGTTGIQAYDRMHHRHNRS